jgi:hypothetical protein
MEIPVLILHESLEKGYDVVPIAFGKGRSSQEHGRNQRPIRRGEDAVNGAEEKFINAVPHQSPAITQATPGPYLDCAAMSRMI